MQCVAVCCSVVQHGAVWCSVVQCLAVCCSVLQCVAAYCSVSTSFEIDVGLFLSNIGFFWVTYLFGVMLVSCVGLCCVVQQRGREHVCVCARERERECVCVCVSCLVMLQCAW